MDKEIFVGGTRYKYQGFTQNYAHAREICENGGKINSNEEFSKDDIVTMFDFYGNYPIWNFYVKV